MQKLNITAILCGLLLSALAAQIQAQTANPSSVLRIACEGDAQDADVHVNGAFKGQCPVDVPVPEGAVQVRVTKAAGALNERVFEQTLRMAAGTAKRLDVVLGAPQLNARGLQLRAEQEAAARRQAEAAAAREAEARAQLERERQDLRQKADAGDVQAMLALARRHERGQGVPRDPVMAHTWTAKAAATGDGEALYRLGRQQSYGFGTTQDPGAALASFRQAAQLGHVNALGHIAAAYVRGDGVPADPAQAEAWAQRGLQGSDGRAAFVLYAVYAPKLAKQMDGDMNWRAEEALRHAAAAGHRGALHICATRMSSGMADAMRRAPCPTDRGGAVDLFKLAARAGDDGEPGLHEAMLRLGLIYEEGEAGQQKDLPQAARWYQLSADAGSARGTGRLASMYKEGEGGLPKDEAKALALFQRAADMGHAFSMLVIGSSYGYGYMGQRIDRKQAIAWYRKGIEAGEERIGKAWLKQLNPGWFE